MNRAPTMVRPAANEVAQRRAAEAALNRT
ncbi:MAG: hypothetical protein RL495_480, partial [Verrucomicrobiota bacterium]